MGIFEMMVGRLGISIIIWLQDHADAVAIVLGIYLTIIVLARYQQEMVQKKTNQLIASTILDTRETGKRISKSSIEHSMKAVWLEQSRRWALFILGKRKLFPVPFVPEKSYSTFVTQERLDEFIKASKNLKK